MKHFYPAILVRFQFCKILVSNSALKVPIQYCSFSIINLILQILCIFFSRYIAHTLRIIHTYLVVPAQLTSSEVFVKAIARRRCEEILIYIHVLPVDREIVNTGHFQRTEQKINIPTLFILFQFVFKRNHHHGRDFDR